MIYHNDYTWADPVKPSFRDRYLCLLPSLKEFWYPVQFCRSEKGIDLHACQAICGAWMEENYHLVSKWIIQWSVTRYLEVWISMWIYHTFEYKIKVYRFNSNHSRTIFVSMFILFTYLSKSNVIVVILNLLTFPWNFWNVVVFFYRKSLYIYVHWIHICCLYCE